jgi:predicted Rossmann fold nucleotide-binding protein DprA/Smf involved in DNA uptake
MKQAEGPPIVLAIVGSRILNSAEHGAVVDVALSAFVAKHGMPTRVVSGGARGADAMGAQWARNNGIELAGLKRNSDIVNACTHVVAFPSTHHGTGTQDSIRKAKAAKKVVYEYPID